MQKFNIPYTHGRPTTLQLSPPPLQEARFVGTPVVAATSVPATVASAAAFAAAFAAANGFMGRIRVVCVSVGDR